MRVAWFTPWPPQRSGVAGRSAEIVPLLAAARHGIDVFVDEASVAVARTFDADPPTIGAIRVQSAHDFVWRAAERQYDVVVYQLGNSTTHEFIWPYLFRWPGLAVLHDTHLHHARGRALLSRKRAAEYRAEFAWNHPELPVDLAELAIRGFDGPYYYDWSMVRSVVVASRLVATHCRGSLDELRESWPDREYESIALAEGVRTAPTDAERDSIRRSIGIPDSAVVFGVFGALSAEKRVPQVMRAFAETHARVPDAMLLLAGAREASVDIDGLAHSLGVSGAIRVLEGLDDTQFDRTIAAADVSLNLRWPTAREMSGPWVRALAAGRATVIEDLVHLACVPSLDPRTWQPHSPGGRPIASDRHEAVTIAIDILDEDHSLHLAMRRLARDRDLRDQLGHAARHYWEAEHSFERATRDYERALSRAAALPDPIADRPAHLKPSAFDQARELSARFGSEAAKMIEMLEEKPM
ncbi:MAG TPA: glycosyltransferase [Vicinamibacterales bacterium]|nr:glycosyltransferase [Vicinamibacterales bacterium]